MFSSTIPTQDDGHIAVTEHSEPSLRRFVIVAAVFLIGMAIFAWSPLWFTPPHFTTTTFIYMGLMLVWILFLGFLIRKSKYASGLILLGLLVNCTWAMVFSQQSLTIQWLFPFSINCTKESDNNDQVRYTCTRSGSDADVEYHFSGRKGLPVMWRESIQSD